MKFRFLLTALALATAAASSEAGPGRRQVQQQPVVWQPAAPQAWPVACSSCQPAGGFAAGTTCANGSCSVGTIPPTSLPIVSESGVIVGQPVTVGAPASLGSFAGDGLDEVNAKRAARGLRPFVRDDGLSRGAMACAQFRASHLLFGHTGNDFGFGGGASATGCAAYPASYGWMSCCTYDGYTFAGAAWVVGADGRRYMSLFVR